MKLRFIFMLLCIFMLSSKGAGKANPVNGPVRTDTILIESKKAALFIVPTAEDINRLKFRYNSEEDFHIKTDNSAQHLSKAKTYLEECKVDVVVIDTTCRVINFANNFYVDLSDTASIGNPLLDILLYRDGLKPLLASSVEIKSEAPDYLGLSLFEIVPDYQATANEAEHFLSFIVDYATNKKFQKQRTLYYAESIRVDANGNTTTYPNEMRYTFDSSLLMRGCYDVAFYHINSGTVPSKISFQEKSGNDMVLTQWGLTGYRKIYYFNRWKQGKWYLLKTKEEFGSTGSDKQDQSSPENFESFIVKFNNDPGFQKKRIVFPLQCIHNSKDRKIAVEISKRNYTLQRPLVGETSGKIALYHINPGEESSIEFAKDNDTNDMVIRVWRLTGYDHVYYFERREGKWKLSKIESNNPIDRLINE